MYREDKICRGMFRKFISVFMTLLMLLSVMSFDSVKAYAAKLKAPVIKSVEATSSSATIKWNKYKGAKGYIIYRKKGSGDYKKIATVKGGSKTSYSDKKLSPKTKYSYKIKVYKTVDKKTDYSSFSKVKTVTTKAKKTSNKNNSSSGSSSNSSNGSSSSGASVGDGYVWIPQTGKKYHSHPSCSNMNGPSKVTVERAEQLGFTPCKRCY